MCVTVGARATSEAISALEWAISPDAFPDLRSQPPILLLWPTTHSPRREFRK